MRKQQVRRGKDGKFASGNAKEPGAATSQTIKYPARRPKGWADEAHKEIISRRETPRDT